jgi:hypothetical protein
MHWLLYTSRRTPIAETAKMLLETYIPQANLSVVNGIENLDRYYRSFQPTPTHALLIVNNQPDLIALEPFTKYLFDMKCLIGWTDRARKDDSLKAFEFCPRFIAYLPEDFVFLQEILQKISGQPLRANAKTSQISALAQDKDSWTTRLGVGKNLTDPD